ncbi:MAG TPA: hypothetical protein VLH09_12620 [Bryobacteraceae bacterium]|nr:hypothetical protein [Bryobacteraceae bacterium]
MRLGCLVLMTAACLAQDPAALFEKAPPDIDEALRSRVKTFYQAHVEGKFRAADALVEEESKELFFGMDKPRCRSFTLGNITYSENFTRAKVMIACDTEMVMMMAGRIPVKMPVLSLWKSIDGQWFWYADPVVDKEVDTPFGVHKPAPSDREASRAGLPGKFVDLATLSSLIKPDKTEVRFSASEPGSDKVVLTSSLPGSATLKLQGNPAVGLSFSLDRTTIGEGESATVSFQYEPVKGRLASAASVAVAVEPTNQVITINISFGAPSAKPGPQ